MRAVNLLPRDAPKKSFEAKRGLAFGAAGGASLVTVALCALMLSAGGSVQERQVQLDSIDAELASLPVAPEKDASADAALVAEKSARISALSAALADRIAWDRVLRQISQVLPEDVWLTSLASKSGAAATAAVPGAPPEPARVVLNGSTYSQSGVARFLSRLSVVPALTNVTLQSSTAAEATGGGGQVVTFTVVADLKSAGAGS